MKFFSTEEIEENVDYLLSVNELGDDWAKGIISCGTKSGTQIIEQFKGTLILWYFYIKIANSEENYELSAKINQIIELEKRDFAGQLIFIGNEDRFAEELAEDIDEEINYLMLN